MTLAVAGRELVYNRTVAGNGVSQQDVDAFKKVAADCLAQIHKDLQKLGTAIGKIEDDFSFACGYVFDTRTITLAEGKQFISFKKPDQIYRVHTTFVLRSFFTDQVFSNPRDLAAAVEFFQNKVRNSTPTTTTYELHLPTVEKILQKIVDGKMKSAAEKATALAEWQKQLTLTPHIKDYQALCKEENQLSARVNGFSLASRGFSYVDLSAEVDRISHSKNSPRVLAKMANFRQAIDAANAGMLAKNPLPQDTSRNLPPISKELQRFADEIESFEKEMPKSQKRLNDIAAEKQTIQAQIAAIDPTHPIAKLSLVAPPKPAQPAPAPISPHLPSPQTPPQQPQPVLPLVVPQVPSPQIPPQQAQTPPQPPQTASSLRGRVSCCSRFTNWFLTSIRAMRVSLARFFHC